MDRLEQGTRLEILNPDKKFEVKEEIQDVSLPPCDRGRGAWVFLSAASVTITMTWGFSSAFGVFREYYFHYGRFKGEQSISQIGVLGLGFLQVLSPVLIRLLRGRPHMRTVSMWVGMLVVVASTIGAAFAQSPVALIMTQGVFYGIGGGLIFAPTISLMEEWFDQRLSLANGLYFSATSIAAAVLSPLFSSILTKFGPRTTLLAWAIVSGPILGGAILCMRSRFHGQMPKEKDTTPVSHTFFKTPLFWFLAMSVVVQGLANYLPAVYVPTYATDIGASRPNAALLLTYFNITSIICQPLLGALADARGPIIPLLLSTVISSASTFIFWGVFRTYWSIVIFVLLFGGFSGGFVVLRSSFASAVVRANSERENHEEALVVNSILAFFRGIATVCSGFVGTAVIEKSFALGIRPGFGAGRWEPLIILVGTLMAIASLGAIGLTVKVRALHESQEDRDTS